MVKRKPGYSWRLLAHADGRYERVAMSHEPNDGVVFDELVVDDWLHVEQMNTRSWWMDVAGVHVNVHIPAKGKAKVTVVQDDPQRATLTVW